MKRTYNKALEIDDGLISLFIVVENGVRQLRCVMASITLSRNVQIPTFVLCKPLQPIHQEAVIVNRCSYVSVAHQIRRPIRIREPYPCR